MTIQFRRRSGQIEWEVKRYPFGLWKLSCVHENSKIWVAIFRELGHLDMFITLFEPMQAASGSNVYVRNAIAEFEADEITADQFRETAQVYGALPEQIQGIIDRKAEAEGIHE
jgi:hypothetical protein